MESDEARDRTVLALEVQAENLRRIAVALERIVDVATVEEKKTEEKKNG